MGRLQELGKLPMILGSWETGAVRETPETSQYTRKRPKTPSISIKHTMRIEGRDTGPSSSLGREGKEEVRLESQVKAEGADGGAASIAISD